MSMLILDMINYLIYYIEPENLEIFDSKPCSRTIALRKLKTIRTITEEVALIRTELTKMGIPNELNEIEIGIDDDDETVLDMIYVLREMLFNLAEMVEAFLEESFLEELDSEELDSEELAPDTEYLETASEELDSDYEESDPDSE